MLLFVGGCTLAEVSCVRFLNEKYLDKAFIIGTTSIISGNNLIENFIK